MFIFFNFPDVFITPASTKDFQTALSTPEIEIEGQQPRHPQVRALQLLPDQTKGRQGGDEKIGREIRRRRSGIVRCIRSQSEQVKLVVQEARPVEEGPGHGPGRIKTGCKTGRKESAKSRSQQQQNDRTRDTGLQPDQKGIIRCQQQCH